MDAYGAGLLDTKTYPMADSNEHEPNTLFIEVTGAGLPEVDGLFVPSNAPPAQSESGAVSSPVYWNGKMAWDRADGASARSPSLSYSNSYRSWRISRLEGHLAYEITCDDTLPPTDREWNVYKKGVAPPPKVVLHHSDPREPSPESNVIFVLGGMGSKLRMGRYLEYPKYGAEGHRTTGNLYLSLMQAAGMKTGATFGQPDANLKHLNVTGPLAELMA